MRLPNFSMSASKRISCFWRIARFFFCAAFAPAQGDALGAIRTLCRLNEHTHFVLAFIARRRLAHDFLPASLLFILIKIADPLRLSRSHQPVITGRLDSRQVLGVGHATIDDHRSIFSFAHPFLQSCRPPWSSRCDYRQRFRVLWENPPRRAPALQPPVYSRSGSRANNRAWLWDY